MRALLAAAGACVVLAIVLGAATDSNAASGVAIALAGTAFVLLISAAFLAVGQSEDRQRARDAGEDPPAR